MHLLIVTAKRTYSLAADSTDDLVHWAVALGVGLIGEGTGIAPAAQAAPAAGSTNMMSLTNIFSSINVSASSGEEVVRPQDFPASSYSVQSVTGPLF